MPINRKLQNIIGTEHITDAAETAIAAQASGGATVAFKNVAVSGQDNIVADAATDTLNIAAGSNITLTTNAGTDTLTIAAAGGTTGYTYTDTDGSEQFLISDTSDTSLFKIEQAGTGNVLEAHDQASDMNIFKIDNSGKTVIGNTSGSTAHSAFSLYVTGDTRVPRLRVGTGSNGEPGIHFEGDSDTGIRRTDADKLGFITGGSERLSIGSAGEVLVGGSASGTSGQVLTSGGSGAAVSWAAAGGGGGLPIHWFDLDSPPTLSNGVTYNNLGGTNGFSIIPGIAQMGGIASGNFTATSVFLWAFTWPSDDHYIDQIKFRIYSASATDATCSFKLGFYKADSNGWPGARTGDEVTITPTSTGAHFLTTTLGSGSGIGPFNRGDLIWVAFAGPGAVSASPGTVRYYGQPSSSYPIAGMNQSTTGPNPGYGYIFPYRLYVNSGKVNGTPGDIRDGSTWPLTGSPSTMDIYPAGTTLSSSTYFPYINVIMRDTA